MQEVEVSRLRLWIEDLGMPLAHHAAMEVDVHRLLAEGLRNEAAYGEQTATCLQDQSGTHWCDFFAAVREAIDAVLLAGPAAVDSGRLHLRAWASRTDGLHGAAGRRFDLRAAHNHAPALVSGVYYLVVPANLEPGEGGTFFLNPLMHPLATAHPGVAIAPEEGRLVLFPGMLTHAMLPSADAGERLVIGIDAWLVPGMTM